MKKLLVKALKYGVFFCVAFVVVVALLPRIPFSGKFQSLVVLSGSMEPTIKTGSVVLVRAQPDYQVGDIITFSHPNDPQKFITHRVVTLSEGDKIITRGDANPSSDMQEISVDDVQGKVMFSIPYLGYVANFARTRFGFAIFIILPAILIIIDEVRGLLGGRSDSSGARSIGALALFFIAAFSFGVSLAYFSDTEAAVGSVLSVSVDWGEEPSVGPGDVVINEVMWMGSAGKPSDEWIELRNMTDQEIDISNWRLTKLVSTDGLMLAIPSDSRIPANGYFLISNFDKATSKINVDPDLVDSSVVLRNGALQVKLYKGDWASASNWVDTADDGLGDPLAGDNTKKYSMERNDIPGDGTLESNWHTCTDATSTTLYWDSEAAERGTPGAANSVPSP